MGAALLAKPNPGAALCWVQFWSSSCNSHGMCITFLETPVLDKNSLRYKLELTPRRSQVFLAMNITDSQLTELLICEGREMKIHRQKIGI